MWRWQKSLARWLFFWKGSGHRTESGRRQVAGALGGELRQRLQNRCQDAFACRVQTASMELQARALGLEDALAMTVAVKDGLAGMKPAPAGRMAAETLAVGICDVGVRLDHAVVRDVGMPDARRAGIRDVRLLTHPRLQSLPVRPWQNAVRSVECFVEQLPAVKSGGRWILREAPLGRLQAKAGEQPYRRTSLDPQRLKDAERQGFLREAEAQRRLPPERGELLAVFRAVPIEMISRLHFLAGTRVLVYRISKGNRTQTRVHDMAAIRDTASRETYLIPHRTQFRVVALAE